jgi:hypothetical protein
MYAAPPPLPHALQPDPSPEADAGDGWARERLERQLRLLDRMAEAGVEMAVDVAEESRRPEVDRGDAARTYARVSRAVRQAILLQTRLMNDFHERRAADRKAFAEAAVEADKVRQARSDRRKCRISWILDRVANAGRDEGEELDRLLHEANERLDDDGLIGDVLSRPVSETVALICEALGVAPDWPRLVEEAWAQEELAGGEVGWPFQDTPLQDILRPPPQAGEAAQRAGGGIPPPLSMDQACELRRLPSSAPDG